MVEVVVEVVVVVVPIVGRGAIWRSTGGSRIAVDGCGSWVAVDDVGAVVAVVMSWLEVHALAVTPSERWCLRAASRGLRVGLEVDLSVTTWVSWRGRGFAGWWCDDGGWVLALDGFVEVAAEGGDVLEDAWAGAFA